jgi:hypoxanthine phosphoribosyltransferase
VPHEIDFVGVSSYKNGARSSCGHTDITSAPYTDLDHKHILLVEDIVDTGLTIACLTKYFQQFNPLSLRTCSLLDKPSRRIKQVQIHYLGFTIPDHFVYGYGLDLDNYQRNLPYIAVHSTA